MAKESRIHDSIDKAQNNALKINQSINDIKWIIFSDHHRGSRDGADDFLSCESTYISALEYYLKNDFTLILLGDVEEFWENPLNKVLAKYQNVLHLEKSFYDAQKLIKVWGNHDDEWRVKSFISRHLSGLFPRLNIYEAINLSLNNNERSLGQILLIHGHQGTLESDRFSFISRFFVRYFWRTFQRIFRVSLSTPAKSLKLKSEHDQIMYNWAHNKKKQLIICGHTHQPVFMSCTHIDSIKKEIAELNSHQNTIDHQIELNRLNKKLKSLEAKQVTSIDIEAEKKQPYYFNSGCCSFSKGQITGIEITSNSISLVHWSKEKERKVLDRSNLEYLFDQLP